MGSRTMTYRACPRCTGHSLFSTGAFWSCTVCGYAITQSALLLDEGRANAPVTCSGQHRRVECR
jgi:hypothetical protein